MELNSLLGTSICSMGKKWPLLSYVCITPEFFLVTGRDRAQSVLYLLKYS